MNFEFESGQILFAEREFAAEPNIQSVPHGVDEGTGRFRGAEASRTFLPCGRIVTGHLPIAFGKLKRVFPGGMAKGSVRSDNQVECGSLGEAVSERKGGRIEFGYRAIVA